MRCADARCATVWPLANGRCDDRRGSEEAVSAVEASLIAYIGGATRRCKMNIAAFSMPLNANLIGVSAFIFGAAWFRLSI